jgi:hypothetical protein
MSDEALAQRWRGLERELAATGNTLTAWELTERFYAVREQRDALLRSCLELLDLAAHDPSEIGGVEKLIRDRAFAAVAKARGDGEPATPADAPDWDVLLSPEMGEAGA